MNTFQREAWLASLKPGDSVAVECNYDPECGYDYVIKIVEQVAPTGHIGLVDGSWYQPDGTEMEKPLYSQYGWGDPGYKLVEVNSMVKMSMRRFELLSQLKSTRWQRVGVEELEKIARILAEAGELNPRE